MTATDELRRLLDERGVECAANDGEYVKETCWTYMGELTAAFAEYYDGTTRFACDTWCFTPEQAIEATLGRGECRLIPTRDKPRSKAPTLTCSKCGWWTDRINDRINYCPSCGKRVKA